MPPALSAFRPRRPPARRADWLANGPFTDPREEAPRLARLVARAGKDPGALAEGVRSWLVHPFWRAAYGLPEEPDRVLAELNLRELRSKLARVGALQAALGRSRDDAAPLPNSHKVVGNCRDHSLLYAALLRATGIPARVRCGFARYFVEDRWIDHWIVERWDGRRWVQSDAQLDAVMHEKLEYDFDPLDLPDGEFVSGGDAWRACRAGADPGRHGIFEFWGWDCVRSNLVRDVNALAGRELLPWDAWGTMLVQNDEQGEAGLAALDDLAAATPMRAALGADEARSLAARQGIAVPRTIVTYARKDAPELVDLGAVLDR